jgi:hypothetical protein
MPPARRVSDVTAAPGNTTLFLPISASNVDLPAAPRTLILTDATALAEGFGLAADDPEMVAWRQAIEALSAHPSVQGRLVLDIAGTDDTVAAAYRAWRTNHDPTQWNRKANAVVRALHDWVWERRPDTFFHLRWIVIAGDDRVVPFFRLAIAPPPAEEPSERANWVTEDEYFDETGLVGAGTTVGAALQAGLTLTDDFYGAPQALDWPMARELPAQVLPVGRLVEGPSDMTGLIQAYLENGILDVDSALLAGYDFMQDGLEASEPNLARTLPGSRLTRLIGPNWTVDELKQSLFGRRHDLFYFAAHANHSNLETPSSGILTATDVVSATVDFRGTLAVGLACHAGLNVPGDDHPAPLDFPEAWARQGATFVASSGWAYGGDRNETGLWYQEVLLARYTELLAGDGGATVGGALVRAKGDYLEGIDTPSSFHAKTIAGTTLYGLPMYRVRMTAP